LAFEQSELRWDSLWRQL